MAHSLDTEWICVNIEHIIACFPKTDSFSVSLLSGQHPAFHKSPIYSNPSQKANVYTGGFSCGAARSPVLLCLKLAAQLSYMQYDTIIDTALCQLS